MRHNVSSIDPDIAADAKVLALSKSRMLNKVPEITIFFWIIKVLATTIGETAADFLNDNLNLGLTITKKDQAK